LIAGVDVLYNGPAGSMLSYIIHSLLLLPVRFVRPLLHELLSLLPYLDKLNAVLPAATVLEAEELSWSLGPGMFLLLYCIMSLCIEETVHRGWRNIQGVAQKIPKKTRDSNEHLSLSVQTCNI